MSLTQNTPESATTPPEVSTMVRTLLTGGFSLEGAERNPGYMLLRANRSDEFGCIQKYCFMVIEKNASVVQVDAAKMASQHYQSQLVLIGQSDVCEVKVEWERFINLFGGPILSTSPLEPEFNGQLIKLAFNKLPEGLSGKADDLFEIYCRTALEFILGTRVVRYGQDRRFEARPDGIVIPSWPFYALSFYALYDSKAYSEGYDVNADTVRQFDSYIVDFHGRYKDYLRRLNSFIVISGIFQQEDEALIKKSQELYAKSGVPMAFLTVSTLIQIIEAIKRFPKARRAIDWPLIFANPIIRPKDVVEQIEIIKRDAVIRKN